MKKLLALFLPLILFITSCQKNEVIIPNRTIVVNLTPSRWIPSNGGQNYTATIDLPELTNEFNERGGVLTYISFGNQSYEQLPEVYGGISYSYVSRPGQLLIELQSSNGSGTITPPSQTVTVKIILVDSDY